MSTGLASGPPTTIPRRRRRRGRAVALTLLTVIVVSLVGVKATDVVLGHRERSAHPAPGQLVEVGGHRMHLQVSGQGEPAIVLLPGLGTASPVRDFEPLTSELSTWATVIVVEPFGYGWSDATDSSMRPAQVASDVQAALTGAGLEGPFVLMAHSLGGLYAQAYAEQYPEQTTAVVGLDPTMPRIEGFIPASEEVGDLYASPLPWYFGVLARGGWVRIAQAVAGSDPNLFSGASSEDGYGQENLREQEMIANWSGLSPNVMAQAEGLADAIAGTRDLRFAADVPVLLITTELAGAQPAWRQDAIEDYLGDAACTRSTVLASGHYVHHTHAEEVSRETRALLEACAG